MHIKNTITEYGVITKILHWVSALLLFIQIPLGFYLVDLDFGEQRINIENIHIIIGLSLFYLVIIRLLIKIFNPTPKLNPSVFKGQKFSENNLTTKRSNTGIPSSNWKKVIGKISNFNFKKDQIIKI